MKLKSLPTQIQINLSAHVYVCITHMHISTNYLFKHYHGSYQCSVSVSTSRAFISNTCVKTLSDLTIRFLLHKSFILEKKMYTLKVISSKICISPIEDDLRHLRRCLRTVNIYKVFL